MSLPILSVIITASTWTPATTLSYGVGTPAMSLPILLVIITASTWTPAQNAVCISVDSELDLLGPGAAHGNCLAQVLLM